MEFLSCPQLYQEYKASLADHIQKRHEFASRTNKWAEEIYNHSQDEYSNLYRHLAERCKIRFHNLGHEMEDIERFSDHIRFVLREGAIHRLTTKAFRRIKPDLEELIRGRRAVRILEARQRLLEGIYHDYLKTLPPEKWQYLPQAQYLRYIGCFDDFLNAPPDKRGDMAPGYAVTWFSRFIEEWTKDQQEELVHLLPRGQGEESFEAKLQRLELATSVFSCPMCKDKHHAGRVLIGRKSICRHRCSMLGAFGNSCLTYEINHTAIAAVVSVVSCVGLDPSTATVDDMNARDDRFMSGNCLPENHRGLHVWKVYTWIECIRHAVEMISPGHMPKDYAFCLLTPEATQFVREHESPYPHPRHQIWRCNHCAHHFQNQVHQKDAIVHAKRVHCIKEPVIGIDVAVDMRSHIRRRRPFRICLDPRFDLRCMHCPELPIHKLWEDVALKKHLKEKHHVNEPVLDLDWSIVGILALRPKELTEGN